MKGWALTQLQCSLLHSKGSNSTVRPSRILGMISHIAEELPSPIAGDKGRWVRSFLP